MTADYRGATASGYRGFYLDAGSGGASDAPRAPRTASSSSSRTGEPRDRHRRPRRVTGRRARTSSRPRSLPRPRATSSSFRPASGSRADRAARDRASAPRVKRSRAMLVKPSGTYLARSSHHLLNFGALWLNAGRSPSRPPRPQRRTGRDAITTAANDNRLLLDDGYSIRIDNAAHLGDQPYFTKDVVVRNGDVVKFPAGGMILELRLRQLASAAADAADRREPRGPQADLHVDPRRQPASGHAPAVGGDITVASFNVFNYFTTLSQGTPAPAVPRPQTQFAIQKSKIVTAINGLDADIVALMEIENSVKLGEQPDEALADLVAGLNAAAGAGKSGLRPHARRAARTRRSPTSSRTRSSTSPPSCKPVGASLTVIDETVWDIAREPIAQTFMYGKQFVTVVANHFKSKSSGPTRRQSRPTVRALQRRARRAGPVAARRSPTARRRSRAPACTLVGDFNSYAQGGPDQGLHRRGLRDLLPTKTADSTPTPSTASSARSTTSSRRRAGRRSVTSAGVWAINSPEWSDRDYGFSATEAGNAVPLERPRPDRGRRRQRGARHGRHRPRHGQRLPRPHRAVGAVRRRRRARRRGQRDPRGRTRTRSFVAAGDMIGASTFTSFIQKDQPTIDALNAVGLDAARWATTSSTRAAPT